MLTTYTDITDAGQTEYTFSGLANGTWYFAISMLTRLAVLTAPEPIWGKQGDCMKLFVLLLLFPLCAMADATSDFAARCNGPGIVCNGFDSSGDLAEGSIQQAYDDTHQFALNTDQKASGASRSVRRSGRA